MREWCTDRGYGLTRTGPGQGQFRYESQPISGQILWASAGAAKTDSNTPVDSNSETSSTTTCLRMS